MSSVVHFFSLLVICFTLWASYFTPSCYAAGSLEEELFKLTKIRIENLEEEKSHPQTVHFLRRIHDLKTFQEAINLKKEILEHQRKQEGTQGSMSSVGSAGAAQSSSYTEPDPNYTLIDSYLKRKSAIIYAAEGMQELKNYADRAQREAASMTSARAAQSHAALTEANQEADECPTCLSSFTAGEVSRPENGPAGCECKRYCKDCLKGIFKTQNEKSEPFYCQQCNEKRGVRRPVEPKFFKELYAGSPENKSDAKGPEASGKDEERSGPERGGKAEKIEEDDEKGQVDDVGLKTAQEYINRQLERVRATIPGFQRCKGVECCGGRVVTATADISYTCPLCDFEGCLKCGKDHPHTVSCALDKEEKENIERILREAKISAADWRATHAEEIISYFNEHKAEIEREYVRRGISRVTAEGYLEERVRTRPGATDRFCYYCGAYVYKVGGCNNLKCPHCKTRIHWAYGDHANHPRHRGRVIPPHHNKFTDELPAGFLREDVRDEFYDPNVGVRARANAAARANVAENRPQYSILTRLFFLDRTLISDTYWYFTHLQAPIVLPAPVAPASIVPAASSVSPASVVSPPPRILSPASNVPRPRYIAPSLITQDFGDLPMMYDPLVPPHF